MFGSDLDFWEFSVAARKCDVGARCSLSVICMQDPDSITLASTMSWHVSLAINQSINQRAWVTKSSACVHLLEMINRTRTPAFRALLADSVEQKKCRAKYHRITTAVTVSTKATIAKSPTST